MVAIAAIVRKTPIVLECKPVSAFGIGIKKAIPNVKKSAIKTE